MSAKEQPVDLDLISATLHNGCMGVPQELVDGIVNMLFDDLRALKACSLTCKSMFASARPLIHQKLYLNLQNADIARTEATEKKTRYKPGNHVFSFLTFMGEHGLLRYTRQIHIGSPGRFTPEALRPHLRYFRSLDRVHTLIICGFMVGTVNWATHFNNYFVNLYPTLTSLSLRFPFGHYRLLLQFVLQFPNLENLCLEKLHKEEEIPQRLAIPAIPDKSPPLSGHLRLCGTDYHMDASGDRWLVDLAHNLPNGIKFRSIELDRITGQRAQHILSACRCTLENLIIVHSGSCYFPDLSPLDLTAATGLRQLTFRTKDPSQFMFDRDPYIQALFAISSPLFREFVIEVERSPHYTQPISPWWGGWNRLDQYLDGLFSEREGCRLIVRVHQLFDREAVKQRAMETFPRLVERGCFHFETFSSIEKFWC